MKLTPLSLTVAVTISAALPAHSDGLDVQPVTDGVWALVGPLEQRNPENLGNNATFGLIETTEGAILIDAGGSAAGAAIIDEVVHSLTDQPVRYVINTGGQDHRWIGNSYWQAQGATVIASSGAVADQQARSSMQVTILTQLIGGGLDGTVPSYADITFDDAYTLELGGRTIELRHPAAAHTPGDSFVWLADADTVFSGDIIYIDRLLGVMEFSNTADWVDAFEAIDALAPAHLVPGHGPATDMATARADTYDYLINLRTQMMAHIDAGGDIIDSVKIDQSAFARLDQFEALAGRNAQTAFQQMEWE